MSVRMYALAKELKLDSKELVDICTKAGIPGKGSALASLTDDEVTKVKEFIASGGKPKPKKKAKEPVGAGTTSGGALRREDYIPPGATSAKMPVLGNKKRTPEKTEQPEQPMAEPEATPEVEPVKAEDKPAEAKQAKKEEAPVPKPPPKKPTRPAIKLAPLPPTEAKQPEPKKNEPAPQKPDLKLPADAIKASKSSGRPLADHLKRHEEKPSETGRRRGKDEPAKPEGPLKNRGKRGRGKKEKEEDRPLLGGREARQLNRKRSGRRRDSDDDTTTRSTRAPRKLRRSSSGVNTAAPRKGNIIVEMPCTVRSFSEATGLPSAQIQRVLLEEGSMVTVNSPLDAETAELIAAELGVEVEFRQQVSLEDKVLTSILDQQDSEDSLATRPPVITFLGHVDHGKTSLLDRILSLNVVSGESGGITQHIRAYNIDKDGQPIAFVDTPGHEAFTEMRARGANVTDIAVLVVAADDGVMPQTEEAISHAKAAGVPIVVAMNKIDLPNADENKVMQDLAANELLPSAWGGDIEVVKTSAISGDGIDELLDTVLTVAELHDYKANPNRAALGTCLEAQQDPERGVEAKVIVQNGTLHVGDVIVCGSAYGRVRTMYNTLRTSEAMEEAGPSTPVNLMGLDVAPDAGERFYVLNDIAQAREIAERRLTDSRTRSLGTEPVHVTLENLFDRLGGEGEVQNLNLILRADVRGSIEAIQKELGKLEHPEVGIKVLQATVGGITEADVHLADASDAIIIGFNVVPDEGARTLADEKGVQIRRYDVIYKVTEELKAALEGMLKPEEREMDLGRALVKQPFKISRVGTVAGCHVIDGTIERNSRGRIIRDNTIIGDYPLDSLRRERDDVKEVRKGMECGIKLQGFDDVKEGDIIEVYRIEEVGRKFDE